MTRKACTHPLSDKDVAVMPRPYPTYRDFFQLKVENEKIEALEKIQCYKNDLQLSKFNLTKLQQEHDQLLSKYRTLKTAVNSDQTKINELTINTEKQRERIELQEIALQKAEDSLKVLTDKHLFLMEEKTTLALQLQKTLETEIDMGVYSNPKMSLKCKNRSKVA